MFTSLTFKQKRQLIDKLYRASSRNFVKSDLRLATGDRDGSFDLYMVGGDLYKLATEIYHEAYKA